MNEFQQIFGLVLTVASCLIIIKLFFNQKNNSRPPRIKKLIIFPIKSIQGIEVDHLEICKSGVKWNIFYDRSLALLNEKRILLTQRNKPQLALVKAQFQNDQIYLDAPGMETLKIFYNFDYSSNELITFEIWGQETQGYDCGKEIEEWFTKFLNSKTKMVKFVDGLKQCRPKVFDKILENSIFYQDGFPILLLNESSIEDLNKRLNGRCQVTHRNFRPNFVIYQADAYEEDQWKKIRINDVEYIIPKPCDRCYMTTVNPDTGIKSSDAEPLKTLKIYRIDERWNKNSALFGINLIPLKLGKIIVGDYLEIVEKNESLFLNKNQ